MQKKRFGRRQRVKKPDDTAILPEGLLGRLEGDQVSSGGDLNDNDDCTSFFDLLEEEEEESLTSPGTHSSIPVPVHQEAWGEESKAERTTTGEEAEAG